MLHCANNFTEFKPNINGVAEEIADRGNADTAAVWETLGTHPEELSEGTLIEIMMTENRCDERDEDISEVMWAKT